MAANAATKAMDPQSLSLKVWVTEVTAEMVEVDGVRNGNKGIWAAEGGKMLVFVGG